MKLLANLHNATFATVILAALGPAPALAQRSGEFGYKDRIFEQKHLLPDGLNAFEVQNYLLMSGLRAMATGGSGFDSRVLEAAGGTCANLFINGQPLPARTPAQTSIDRMPRSREPQSPEELARLKRSPFLGHPEVENSGVRAHAGGDAGEPFMSAIGGLLPIALCGRTSL